MHGLWHSQRVFGKKCHQITATVCRDLPALPLVVCHDTKSRATCGQMLAGLLMELEDKNCWTLAEAVGHPTPDRPQHFLARASWDEQQVMAQAARWAIEHLDGGDTDHTVLIIDETADAKSSIDAAGSARQYSGTLGEVALCQVAVHLAYATPRGHTILIAPRQGSTRPRERRPRPTSTFRHLYYRDIRWHARRQ